MGHNEDEKEMRNGEIEFWACSFTTGCYLNMSRGKLMSLDYQICHVQDNSSLTLSFNRKRMLPEVQHCPIALTAAKMFE